LAIQPRFQRRRRSLISAQGWSAATTLGIQPNNYLTLKGFASWRTLSAFRLSFNSADPGLSLRSNPGLKLANAFGVKKTRAELANAFGVKKPGAENYPTPAA
jgi:hypothetical protein